MWKVLFSGLRWSSKGGEIVSDYYTVVRGEIFNDEEVIVAIMLFLVFSGCNFCLLACISQFVGFVWGYIIQQFSETVRILGAGFILAAIVSADALKYV